MNPVERVKNTLTAAGLDPDLVRELPETEAIRNVA